MWQVLPLGPTGYGDSPYQCFSAFGGNPLLIDLAALAAEGLVAADDLAGAPAVGDQRVDYGAVIAFKLPLLDRAAERFRRSRRPRSARRSRPSANCTRAGSTTSRTSSR